MSSTSRLRSAGPSPLRLRRSWRLGAVGGAAVIWAATIAGVRPAHASPLDDPHVGGVGWGGPTTGDLTAVYWNPAALALLQGTQATVSGSARLQTTGVDRAAIDPTTGQPGGSRSFPSATGNGNIHPVHWPPGPGGFAAVGADLAGRFSIAFAAFTPFAQRLTYAPAANGDAPTRYHLVEADIRNVALVPAIAFRIGNDLRVGVAPGFLFSVASLAFDEDTALGATGAAADCGGSPCGVENPAAAARYRVASGFDPFDASPSVTLSAGVHYRRGVWEWGVAYASRPLDTEGGSVEVNAPKTQVDLPPRALGSGGVLCPPQGPDTCVLGRLSYRLPDMFTAGATWHLSPRWDLMGIARWMTWSRHDRVSLRVVGPASGGLRSAGLPEQIVLYRGFRDTFDLRLRAITAVHPRVPGLRLAFTLRVETSAVASSDVNPAAVDGFKIEPAVAVHWRIGSHFALAAGYAVAVMPSVDTGRSVFDPAAAGACRESGNNLETPACRTQLVGAARPTAAGTYSQSSHTFSLGVTAKY